MSEKEKRSKIVILIVDDNLLFTERMIDILHELNNIRYINVASDYNEACRIVKHEMPDLVLLDINLPGKNGIDFLRLIKEENKKCTVVMLTNHSDDYYRQLCKQIGADHFLDKSNDFARVPEIVSRIHAN